MFPILVFVGLEITAQSFQATPTRHYPALALAVLPALAYLITIPLNTRPRRRDAGRRYAVPMVQTLRCLANGFLITGLLWAAALAMMLDGRLGRAAAFLALAGVCAFFGVIHSPLASERISLPYDVLLLVQQQAGGADFWNAVRYQTPYHWATAYGLSALLLLGLKAKNVSG